MKPGEGLDIPLDAKVTKKYRLTLKETFKYMYDVSDKTCRINQTPIYYVNDAGKSSTETVTTLERIEVVIRDVSFDNNYLGAAFLNAVTHAEDYNDEVDKRKKIVARCLKIPGIRCSKPMSDNDLRQARNAMRAIDSLLDVNNGRGLEPKLNYGNFLKTFEQALVASSAKEAQEVQLFPLKQEVLLKHNGKLVGDMTRMTMWSNTARVIRDRVGRTRDEFNAFVNSKEFNHVDKALVYGFDLPEATASAEKLLRKMQIVQEGEKQNAIDNTIDWLASLNYDQTRLVEDTIGRLLFVSSYLGSPEIVFERSAPGDISERYKNNNLFQLFTALEKIMDHYATLKGFFPTEMKLIDAFKPLNTALVFLGDSLKSTNIPEKNIAYLALNDVFVVMQTVLFDDLTDPRIGTMNSTVVKGLDLLLGFLQNPKNVNQTYVLIRDNYNYLSSLHDNEASWFKAVGINVDRMASNEKVDLKPFRDYLNFTTKSAVCMNQNSECPANYHFDEPANFLVYLTQTVDKGDTYFTAAAKKVLVENFDQLNLMLDDLIPSIKIKEVKPPLKFN